MRGKLVAVWSPCSGSGVTTLCTALISTMTRVGSVLALDLNHSEPSLALRAVRPGMVRTHLDSLLPMLRGRRLSPDELEPYITPVGADSSVGVLAGFLHPMSAMQAQEADIHTLLDSALAKADIVLADLNPTLDAVTTWPVLERADKVIWAVGGSYESRYHTRRHLPLQEQLGFTPERVTLTYIATHSVPMAQAAEEIGAMPDIGIPGASALREHEAHIKLSQMPGAYRKAVLELAQMVDGRLSKRAKAGFRWLGVRRAAHAER